MMLLASAFVAAMAAATASSVVADSWVEVDSSDGIRVWQRDRADGLVEFRADVTIQRGLLDVFAVLYDHHQRARWMVRTEGHRVVRQQSETRATLYAQVVVGFPFISHRDAVFEVNVELLPSERRVRATFSAVDDPLVPPVDGIVRMPALEGLWSVEAVEPRRTRVLFVGYGDPGGWIPRWMVNLVARRMPRLFLERIRELSAGREFVKTKSELQRLFDWRWLEEDQAAGKRQ